MGYWGILTWIGDSGSPPDNHSFSVVRLTTGTVPLSTFLSAMEAHTLCNKKMYSIVYTGIFGAGPPEAGANVDKKANIFYRDPTDLSVYCFSYPSPIAGDIEVTPAGKRIKASAVAAIVGYISTMTGVSYIPLHGTYTELVE